MPTLRRNPSQRDGGDDARVVSLEHRKPRASGSRTQRARVVSLEQAAKHRARVVSLEQAAKHRARVVSLEQAALSERASSKRVKYREPAPNLKHWHGEVCFFFARRMRDMMERDARLGVYPETRGR